MAEEHKWARDLKLDPGTSSKSNSYLLDCASFDIFFQLANHPTNSRQNLHWFPLHSPVMTSIEVRYIFCSHWSVQKLTSSALVVALSSFSANVQFFNCCGSSLTFNTVRISVLLVSVRLSSLHYIDANGWSRWHVIQLGVSPLIYLSVSCSVTLSFIHSANQPTTVKRDGPVSNPV